MGNLLKLKQMFKATCLVATATIASAVKLSSQGDMNMDDVREMASEYCLAPISQVNALKVWSEITGGRTTGDMTKEEGLRDVQIINMALGDDVKLSIANADAMGLENCVKEGANAAKNASNTLTCVANQINLWSGAAKNRCLQQMNVDDRMDWWNPALAAWAHSDLNPKNQLVQVAGMKVDKRAVAEKALALAKSHRRAVEKGIEVIRN